MSGQTPSETTGDPQPEGQRGTSFTATEVGVLVDHVLGHYDALFGSDRANKDGRNRIWDDCVVAINAEGVATRTFKSVKKRWEDLRSRTLIKARRLVEGGRGSLSTIQLRVLERVRPALHARILQRQTRPELSVASEEEGGDGAVEPSGGDASTGRRRKAQFPSKVYTSCRSAGTGAASATTAAAEGVGEPPQGHTTAEDDVETSRLVVSTEEGRAATLPHMGPGGGIPAGAGGAVQGQGQEAAQVTVEGPVHVTVPDPGTAPPCTSRDAPSKARPQVGGMSMSSDSPLPADEGITDRMAKVLVGVALTTRDIRDDVHASRVEHARHHEEQRGDVAQLGVAMVGGFVHVSANLATLSSSVEAVRQSCSMPSSGPDTTRAPCGPAPTNAASSVEIPSLPQSGVGGPAGVDTPPTEPLQMEDVPASSGRARARRRRWMPSAWMPSCWQRQLRRRQRQARRGRQHGSGPSPSEGQASAGGQEDPGRDVSSVWQRLGQRIDAERQRAEEERLTIVRAEFSMRRALRRVECLEAARRELEVDMALSLRDLGARTETRLRDIDMEFEDALAHNITE